MKDFASDKIVELCKPFWSDDEEVVIAALFDQNSKPVATEVLQKGSSTEVCFDTKAFVKQIAKDGVWGVVLLHNHPNGGVKPSEYDVKVTKIFVEECENANIKVLDHIIVTKSDFFSFAAHGIL